MMYSVGEFAKKIGKSVQTLRDWEKKGILIPAYKTKGHHRMYSEDQLNEIFQRFTPLTVMAGSITTKNEKLFLPSRVTRYALRFSYKSLHNFPFCVYYIDEKK